MQSSNKPVILFDIDYTLFNTDVFKKSELMHFLLYDDVIPALTKLSHVATLGIFSEGVLDFQNKKLHETGIIDLFDPHHMYIEVFKQDKIRDLAAQYQNTHLYVVDDKLQVLTVVKEHLPNAHTVWIRRGVYAEQLTNIPGFIPDASIDTLTDLPRIIKPS